MAIFPNVGDRYRLKVSVDRYPHFIAPQGATGTISLSESVGQRMIGLTLDEPLKGCEEWDNEIQWLDEDAEHLGDDATAAEAFFADAEPIA